MRRSHAYFNNFMSLGVKARKRQSRGAASLCLPFPTDVSDGIRGQLAVTWRQDVLSESGRGHGHDDVAVDAVAAALDGQRAAQPHQAQFRGAEQEVIVIALGLG